MKANQGIVGPYLKRQGEILLGDPGEHLGVGAERRVLRVARESAGGEEIVARDGQALGTGVCAAAGFVVGPGPSRARVEEHARDRELEFRAEPFVGAERGEPLVQERHAILAAGSEVTKAGVVRDGADVGVGGAGHANDALCHGGQASLVDVEMEEVAF
jgi:hypothetical protein